MSLSASHAQVEVRPVPGGRGLFTTVPVRAGETVLELDGVVKPVPDRFSIQVGVASHLHPSPEAPAEREAAAVPWWFLNHSCEPAVRIEGCRAVALRDLGAGEQLTFDYDSTEWSIAEPFRCGCGRCDGRLVRGYAHLDAGERARRAACVAPHLLRLAGHGHA